ncbi:MAG TPA: RNA polymerase sigma factor [Burkholderiales bacterium]|nr:RNA polymerase sigma factor [Burkholderiales bacterium]
MEAGDEQLMLAYREGDAGAFEQLYKRHRGGLYRFVLRSVRDRATADELYQEIWMRVIEARGRYEHSALSAGAKPAKFTTWLYTIAHNRMVDHWRKRGLTLVSLDQKEPGVAEPAAGACYEPHRVLEAKQSLARFARALEALPPAQREAFLLHEEAGMSAAEIAQATGAGEEAAKSRLRYALSKLKEAVADE